MQARSHHTDHSRKTVLVNRNLEIEVSFDEILDDLLYPAARVRTAQAAKSDTRPH